MTRGELKKVLEEEAWKSRISFALGAAELFVRCGNGLSSLMLHGYKKAAGLIEQIKQTNQPCVTVEEVSTALGKLRVEIPPSSLEPTSRNV